MENYIDKICRDDRNYTLILKSSYGENKSFTIMKGKGTEMSKDINLRSSNLDFIAYPEGNISESVLKHINDYIKDSFRSENIRSCLGLGDEFLLLSENMNGIWTEDTVPGKILSKTVESYLPNSKYMFITQKKGDTYRKINEIPFSQLSLDERLAFGIADDYKIDPFDSKENWLEHDRE